MYVIAYIYSTQYVTWSDKPVLSLILKHRVEVTIGFIDTLFELLLKWFKESHGAFSPSGRALTTLDELIQYIKISLSVTYTITRLYTKHLFYISVCTALSHMISAS